MPPHNRRESVNPPMPMNWNHDRPPSSPYKAYLENSCSPMTGLVFALPFVILYHIGVWMIRESGEPPWANGADILLAKWLYALGIGGPMISLLFLIIVLLIAQQISGRPWRWRSGTLGLMLLESVVFALPPFLLGNLVGRALMAAGAGAAKPLFVNLILSLGAGVYEEFLFRMLLMGLFFLVLQRLFPRSSGLVYFVAVLSQAVLFSLFHYLPGSNEVFVFPVFAFRTLAGIYFAYIYQERGFGIAAGSHALYDVIAVMLNAFR